MKKITFQSLLLLGVISFSFNSCKKEEPDTETQSSTDNSLCEGEFSRIFPEANGFAISEPGVHRIGYNAPVPPSPLLCGTVTIDTANAFPVTVTIDYGSGCQGNDGKTRQGQLIVVVSNSWDSIGTTITITPQNYSVTTGSGTPVSYSGTITITKTSALSHSFKVTNGKCWNASWTILWECDRTITQTAGSSTIINPFDDEYQVYGTAHGTNRDGKIFDVNVPSSDPLVRKMSCQWISDGIFELTPEGLETRTVDFGTPNNGACDDKATLIIKGNKFEFTIQ